MKTNPSPTGRRNLAKRLGAYSAAAAATAVATDSADAANVMHDIPDVTVGIQPGLLFNLITGATATPAGSAGNSVAGSFRIASYSNTNPYIAGPAGSTLAGFMVPVPAVFAAGVNVDASNLAFGNSVSVGENFAANISFLSYGNYAYLANFNAAQGYVGLQFDIGGSLHYGWAEVTFLGTGNGITLHSFGYNDTAGETALTGIPEPSSVLLFAAGAAGLGMRRRRKVSA